MGKRPSNALMSKRPQILVIAICLFWPIFFIFVCLLISLGVCNSANHSSIKVHIFWEDHKILRNLHLTFVEYTNLKETKNSLSSFACTYFVQNRAKKKKEKKWVENKIEPIFGKPSCYFCYMILSVTSAFQLPDVSKKTKGSSIKYVINSKRGQNVLKRIEVI